MICGGWCASSFLLTLLRAILLFILLCRYDFASCFWCYLALTYARASIDSTAKTTSNILLREREDMKERERQIEREIRSQIGNQPAVGADDSNAVHRLKFITQRCGRSHRHRKVETTKNKKIV